MGKRRSVLETPVDPVLPTDRDTTARIPTNVLEELIADKANEADHDRDSTQKIPTRIVDEAVKASRPPPIPPPPKRSPKTPPSEDGVDVNFGQDNSDPDLHLACIDLDEIKKSNR
jgi:hypothetical protein